MALRKGRHTILFETPPSLRAFAAIGSDMEAQGPLGQCFDLIERDAYFGQDSWERAESQMQERVVRRVLEKAQLPPSQVQGAFAGDLLNQCVGSTYGLRGLGVPYVGLFGACSTMAEALMAAAVFLEAGAMERAVACTSSHFCSAERQFRSPLEYGGQRPPTAQWTATAAGAALLDRGERPPFIRGAVVGAIRDLGITDAANMGAAMAPAAADTLARFFADTGLRPQQFDLVVTGDLGLVGSRLLRQLLEEEGFPLDRCHADCGLMLYDRQKQDVHAGGSGCGCSAAVLCGHLLPLLRQGTLQNLLFVATGALMSPTVVQQGESIPGIAHLVWLSHKKSGEVASCRC